MAGEKTPIATEMRRAYENTNGALALLRWRDDVLASLAQHERDLAAALKRAEKAEAAIAALVHERDTMRAEIKARDAVERSDVWYWQGDGSDHPESLANSCHVVMTGAQLRDLAAALARAEKAEAERDALAARVAEVEASRWQPIETCPDSCRGEYPKYVLFYNGHHRGVGFCYPSEDGDGGTLYVDETDQIVTPRPTHWMPLPPPPADAALSREEKP